MWSPLLSWLLLLATRAHAIPPCPYNGPAFPKPTDFSSATMQAALDAITTTFEGRDADAATNPALTSYSIQVFSAAGDEPIWERYHSSQQLEAYGVSAVDGDSVYRIGSLTKIFTVYTFLVEAGDTHWNEPVTKWVPELADMAANYTEDPLMNVDWDSITLGMLASQLSGVVRDVGISGELTQALDDSDLYAIGFPALPQQDVPQCGEYPVCNRAQIFDNLSKTPPSVATAQTAAYSDVNFFLLAFALESITGRNFQAMLQNDVLDRLGLSHTFYTSPATTLGPQPPGNSTAWFFDMGPESPTGNIFSSAADLANLGRSVFRSTLLKPQQTRRWLKPASLTSELAAGVGYPWGVRRVPLSGFGGGAGQGHRVVDTYNKAGGIGSYSALLVMIPDYDVGVSVLAAGNAIPGNHNWNMADAIGTTLMAALEATAREQAQAMYGGTYRFVSSGKNSSNALNSSITITTDPDLPGLGIGPWTSNGTDMAFWGSYLSLTYQASNPSIRLYPTGLEATNADGSKRVAFKAIFQDLDAPSRTGSMFSTDCGAWVGQTSAVYANQPLDQFVFSISADGKVTSIEPLALRVTLTKMG